MSFDFPPIPDPMLETVENDTPFPHMSFDKMGKGRLFYDVVACRMTFKLAPGVLELAEEQAPLVVADTYFDPEKPEFSSLKAAGDTVLIKPGCDIHITGTARHSLDTPQAHWVGGIRVSAATGERLIEHHMRFTGPRFWEYLPLRGWQLTEPQPIHEIQLRHELGFGGKHGTAQDGEAKWCIFGRNPVGRGFLDPAFLEKDQYYPAAQIEDPRAPITSMAGDYALVCPAPIPRFWSDRLAYCGTFDDLWLQQYHNEIIPDYPGDFDLRFFHAAPPPLVHPQPLKGNEIIHLAGASAEQAIVSMQLPGTALAGLVTFADGRTQTRALKLDTLHVDLNAKTVAAVWRIVFDQRECVKAVQISSIQVQA